MSKNIASLAKVVNQQALETITSQLPRNIWAIPSRSSPNADKLIDGAIQRMSVVPDRHDLDVKVNTDKVGFYKREELNERCSGTAYQYSNVWDAQDKRDKIARIYHPEKKHVHNHPNNKNIGKYWVIEFESQGNYKSPLNFWTSASKDQYGKFQMKIGSLSAAIKVCEQMGWGYDLIYPHQKWH